MPSNPAEALVCIGRKEFLDFPDWGVRHVRVKVDTGARTSAVDALDYEVCNEGKSVRLRLALDHRRPDQVTVVETPLLRTTVVRNSGGYREQRPVVEALVRLGPVTRRIRLNIANRSAMRHRMILGREALAGTFLVDVSRKYLCRRVQA